MDSGQSDPNIFKNAYQNTPDSARESSLPTPTPAATTTSNLAEPLVDQTSATPTTPTTPTTSNSPAPSNLFQTIATIGAIITFLGIFSIFASHWNSLSPFGRIFIAILAPFLAVNIALILKKFAKPAFSEVFFFLYSILVPISISVIAIELIASLHLNDFLFFGAIFTISGLINLISYQFFKKSPIYFFSHIYFGLAFACFAGFFGRELFPDPAPTPIFKSEYNYSPYSEDCYFFTCTAIALFGLFEIFLTEFTRKRLKHRLHEALLTTSIATFFLPLLYLSSHVIYNLNFQPASIYRFGIVPFSLLIAFVASLKFHRHILFILSALATLIYAIILAEIDFSSFGFAAILTFSGITLLALSLFSAYAYKTYFPEHLINPKTLFKNSSPLANTTKIITFLVTCLIALGFIIRILEFIF